MTPDSPSSFCACRCATRQTGMTRSNRALPDCVSRWEWTRASSSATSSSQPLARIRSKFRLTVECHGQQGHLTRGQAERAKRIIVHLRNDPSSEPKARRDAGTHSLRSQFFRLICHPICDPQMFIACIYRQSKPVNPLRSFFGRVQEIAWHRALGKCLS